MNNIVRAQRRKTASICPVCGSPMYMVRWYDRTRSLMCVKCHFGFNYGE